MTRGVGRAANLLVLVIVLMLLGQAAVAGSPAELERELKEKQEQLDSARTDLHGVSAEVEQAKQELLATQARLAEARAELASLETRLEEATAVHRSAVAEKEKADQRVRLATMRLERTERRLETRIARFDARVAATYKYGGITYADVVFESADFGDFLSSVHYVRKALDYDKDIIDDITALTRELARRRAEVEELRQLALAEEQRAREAREEMASLTSRQRTVTAEVEADEAQREELVTRLESVQAEHQAQVDALEEDSQALTAELQREYIRLAGSGGWGGWVAGEAPKPGGFAWPTSGRVSSGYGNRVHPVYGTTRMHTGVDIPAPTGQSIVAASDGVVVSAGWRGGYGMAVVIGHGGGVATLYGHMSRIDVSEGQRIEKGEHLGAIGSTGLSTGPHLHFEVRVDGAPTDPQSWYR